MNEHRAFLNAIHERLDDDAPRLMYADWLTEQGQSERGEFIHIQCELARMEYDDPRRPDFEARQWELLLEYNQPWAGSLADLTLAWTFRRGFIEAVTLRTARFLAEGRGLFATEHPIREVRLTSLAEHVVALFEECDLLKRLTTLDLRRNHLHDQGCERLAGSPHLSGLRRLNLRDNGVSARGLVPLIESTHLPSLDALDLSENRTYFFYRGSQFLGSPGLRRIRSLDLRLTGLGDEGMQVLAGSVHLSNLRRLAAPNTTLTDRGVHALIRSPYLNELEELDLSGNYFGAEAARALADWPGARNLRKLWLTNNAIGDDGVRALAHSPHLDALRFVSVSSSSISERGRDALRDRFGDRIQCNVRHGSPGSVFSQVTEMAESVWG